METDIKNILIPIDLSDTAFNALNTAIQMAKRHKANLHLLYVQDMGTFYSEMGRVAMVTTSMAEVWQKEKVFLEKLTISIMHSHHLNCNLHIVAGYRAAVIAQQSDLLKADITVLGTDPDISYQTYMTDSLPYKVLQETDSHLLTVPAGKSVSQFKKIIFPAFRQENSVDKLWISKSIIEKNDAEVVTVGLIKKKDVDLFNSIRVFSEKLKSMLRMIGRSLSQQSVYKLNATKDIISISKKEHAQLLIVEADTKRNLKEFFFGNFTQRMIRNTVVPVLFVKDLTVNEDNTHPLNVAYANEMQFSF